MKNKDVLDSLQQVIGNKLKGVHVSILSDSDIASTREWFPTPAYDLNRILSGSLKKGIPNKSLTLFVGPETSGKSSLMALCIKKAQEEGFTPCVFDTEGSWDGNFVSRWGLDPENIMYVYTPWVDKIAVALGNIINSDMDKLAIVIDSIGGMERRKVVDDAIGDGRLVADQGSLQREIKRTLKMLLNIVKGKNSVGMCAGHYYGNPNSYGTADEIGGGKFVKLAPDIIVSLKKEQIRTPDRKTVIGNKIKAMTIKNRFYPPFNEAYVDIDFNRGINRWVGILDLAMKAGIVLQKGSWYSMGEEKLGQGVEKATQVMEEVYGNKLLDDLDEWLRKTGYSTINENEKEALSLIEEEGE